MGPQIELFEGLKLRLFTREDVPVLFDAIQKNKAHLSEWRAWYQKLDSKRATQAFIDENERQYGIWVDQGLQLITHPGFQFGIFDHQHGVLGMIGYQAFNFRNKISALGYWLDQDVQGKGIITQAAKKLIEFGWDVIGIHRFEIQAWVGNTRSAAVAERLGFVHEAVLKEVEFRDGVYVDHDLFRLLPSDVNLNK
jgi:ribosomal-protein-serine acetyltransferase